MLALINAGFGNPIGRSDLDYVRNELTLDGVRQDIPDDHTRAQLVIDELAGYPRQRPIFLVGGGKMRRHDGHSGPVWTHDGLLEHVHDTRDKLRGSGYLRGGAPKCGIEIGNEPDLAHEYWRSNPTRFASLVREAEKIISRVDPTTPVISGGISNLNRRGLDYLGDAIRDMSPTVHIGVHRYPHKNAPLRAHEGFRNRNVELAVFRSLIGTRKFWVTETGRSELYRPNFFFWKRTVRVEPNDIADTFDGEYRFWKNAGAEGFVWYQLNDGHGRRVVDDHFGIRTVDGAWKPVADQIRRTLAA